MAGGAFDNQYTYDLEIADGGPRKPDLHDLGGEDFADKVTSSPQKGRDPFAGFYSEHARNVAGLNRLTPSVVLQLEWSGSAWQVTGLGAMGRNVEESSFTLTPGPTGTVTISWDPGLLPPMERKPVVIVLDDFGYGYGTVDTSTSIVVRLRDSSNSAANANFQIEIG